MHVGIIMDGNGRWAQKRGLPRSAGHEAGARAVRRIVEAAARSDVDVLTLYAFSSNNWSRPTREVKALMRLLQLHLQSEAANCRKNGVRINVIGRRDRLKPGLVKIVERAEAVTAGGTELTLRLAVDYSARDIVERAAKASCTATDTFAVRMARVMHAHEPVADVDLLIRSGGERRLSDFLLWECAYAELVFIDKFWPEFNADDLHAALIDFELRERRFGGLPVPIEKSAMSGIQ